MAFEQCSAGAQTVPRKPPSHHSWTVNMILHGLVFSWYLWKTLTLLSKFCHQNQRQSLVWATFYCLFSERVWLETWVSCPWLTAPGEVCCFNLPASRFDVLCVQRCSSPYFGCNRWSLMSSCQVKDVWPSTKCFCPGKCHLLDIFSFSEHCLYILEMTVWKSSSRSVVSEILRLPWHKPCYILLLLTFI